MSGAAHGRRSRATGTRAASPRHGSPHKDPQKKSAQRRNRSRNVASSVLIALGIILLLVAAGLFIHAQLGYKQASDFYDGLSKEVLKDSDSEHDDLPAIDFDALKKVNEDVVGWIYIPKTNVSYVVAQGKTNDTYLRHLITGEYNASGTVFLDMDATRPGMVDQQTTIYGHHMNDGSMFSFINETLDQATFDKVEKVYYITPDTTYELKPMFTMSVDDDYLDARVANFESDEVFKQYLKASFAKAKAFAKDTGEQIDAATKVMTLVTCDDAFLAQTKRSAMVCTLVGEVEASAPASS